MVTPLCSYFNDCAGCAFQQVDYSSQLERKRKILALAVNLNIDKVKVHSANSYYYRNRLEFLLGTKGFGLRNKDGKVIPIDKCVIAEKKINDNLTEVNKFFENVIFQSISIAEALKTFHGLVLRTTSQGFSSLSIVIKSGAPKQEWAIEKIKEFSLHSSCENVLLTLTDNEELYSADYLVLKGQDYLEEPFLDKKIQFPIQGFFQNNTKMAEEIQKYIRKLISDHSSNSNNSTKNTQLLDLYSGVGCFGIINANLFQKVTFIESFAPAIDYAKRNMELNAVKNGEAYAFEAKKMRRLKFLNDIYVITDPPRIGMEMETINILKSLKPKIIIYVSCNIEQLKKDLLKFKNYTLKSAALFDFFPQTKHIEAVVGLSLNIK
ncbi:class I SAM-dependent RNA methyltransferase [Candidatus Woesearchaeota archaeon]|nr:class I SAM-dependent RNA methyltransferase [Candidatus Woesearchaeota archaeon]